MSFDSLEFTRFDPESLFTALATAAMRAYAVVIVDSYSAFWNGAGRMLDKVDNEARAGYGGTSAGWAKYRPVERRVTEALAAYPGHVIVTLKARTETVVETGAQGHQFPRRISVRPEQRADLEYDFDVVGTLGPIATMYVGKSRVPSLAGQVIEQPGEDLGLVIRDWADDGVPNWPQPSFIERARGPEATVDGLRQLWADILAARAGGMAALDLHDRPTTLSDLVKDRGNALRATAQTTSPGPAPEPA